MRKYVLLLCFFVVGFSAARAIASTDTIIEPDLGIIDRIESLWRSGAVTNALILAAFFVLTLLRAHVAWLREGHRATIVASLIGGLGMLVQTVSNGVTPNMSMLIGAATTAMAIAMNPKHEESKRDGDPPADQPPGGLPTATAVKT